MTKAFVSIFFALLVLQGPALAKPPDPAAKPAVASAELGLHAPMPLNQRAVQELVDALASNDKAAVRDWVDRRFSTRAFRFFLPRDQLVEQLETVKAQTGGSRILEVQAQGEPLTVIAQPKIGGYRILLLVGADLDEQGMFSCESES